MQSARATNRWALVVGALMLVAVAAQIQQLDRLFDPTTVFGADGAQEYARFNALLVIAAGLLALVLPARRRWLLVAGAAVPLAGVLAVCVAGEPGRGWSLLLGILTLTACWETGERLLRRLGAPQLAAIVPVAWLAGTGVLATVLLVLGRTGLLSWWNCGLAFFAVGCSGAVRLVRRGLPHRRAAFQATIVSPLAAACAALVLLDLAWLAVYAFAPELGVDALAAKAWLPKFWADAGNLEPVYTHAQFAVVGNAQTLAVPGHLLGGPDVGRWMQYGAGLALAGTVWWWGRRFGVLGPLAAFAAVASPTFAFQAGSAFDDLLLTLAAVAMVLAVVTLLEGRSRGDGASPAPGIAIAVGVLGGALLSLKLHLVYLDAALLGGWVLAGGPLASAGRRLVGVLAGASLTAVPPIALRVLDWQNPVFPAYNNIFKSKYWPPVNEHFNFPFWPDPPLEGFLTWPWQALRAASPLLDIQTPGFLGLLLPVVVGALLLVVPAFRARPTRVLWIALALSLLCWYLQLRYLRYLMPTAAAGLLLLLAVLRVEALGRWPERVAVIGITAMAAAVFPSQVAQFYPLLDHKVPLAAARGSWEEASFLRAVWPERDAFAAADRLTPPGARILSGNYQRLWLTDRRDVLTLADVSLLPGHGATMPTAPESLRRRLDAVGVRWLMFSRGPGFEPSAEVRRLMDVKGELRWADRNYELWHIAATPDRPVVDRACDPLLRSGSCWAAPALDARPGLTAAEAGPGATVTVPTCPGQTVTVRVTVPKRGVGAHVLIDAVDQRGDSGSSAADVGQGVTRLVGTTTPSGATLSNIVITPAPGGTVERAEVGYTGAAC